MYLESPGSLSLSIIYATRPMGFWPRTRRALPHIEMDGTLSIYLWQDDMGMLPTAQLA